jgi:glyoxylase-like metal-dependent hydrolase (beta-lactamase superfamily II)
MQIASGIYRAESSGEVIYALDCGQGYALVDCGSAPGLPAKFDCLRADGIDPGKIAAVFITHHHGDHCQALGRMRKELSPRVVAHRLAVERLAHCTASEPIPRELVDYTVDEGDTVEVGDLTIEVHHLPGHTADSVAWQLGPNLFVGDIIFADGGIGWMDVHWGSCVSDYRSSLLRLPRLKAQVIYPGHRDHGPLTRGTIDEALRRLTALSDADGSPLAALGRPAPRRHPEGPSTLVRLPAAHPS